VSSHRRCGNPCVAQCSTRPERRAESVIRAQYPHNSWSHNTTWNVASIHVRKLAIRSGLQFLARAQNSSSATVIKEMTATRPCKCGSYSANRESCRAPNETTSVSRTTASISQSSVLHFDCGARAAYSRSRPSTHPLAKKKLPKPPCSRLVAACSRQQLLPTGLVSSAADPTEAVVESATTRRGNFRHSWDCSAQQHMVAYRVLIVPRSEARCTTSSSYPQRRAPSGRQA
jgi:hypothetical protein